MTEIETIEALREALVAARFYVVVHPDGETPRVLARVDAALRQAAHTLTDRVPSAEEVEAARTRLRAGDHGCLHWTSGELNVFCVWCLAAQQIREEELRGTCSASTPDGRCGTAVATGYRMCAAHVAARIAVNVEELGERSTRDRVRG